MAGTTVRPAAPGLGARCETAALNRRGVLHVVPGEPRQEGAPLPARDLFARLYQSVEPRLHQSALVLLLTHPHLAIDARLAIDELSGVMQERAKRRYVAAAALQRMARTRIALALGPQSLIPSAYLDEFELPQLDDEFGRRTLLVLSAQEAERFGYDAWGTCRTLLEFFLSEIRRQGWGATCDIAPTANA
jgi:hypothetical protein